MTRPKAECRQVLPNSPPQHLYYVAFPSAVSESACCPIALPTEYIVQFRGFFVTLMGKKLSLSFNVHHCEWGHRLFIWLWANCLFPRCIQSVYISRPLLLTIFSSWESSSFEDDWDVLKSKESLKLFGEWNCWVFALRRSSWGWLGIFPYEYSPRASPYGLSAWASLGFLTAWWPRSSQTVYITTPSSSTCPSWKGRSCITSRDLALEVTRCHFSCLQLLTSESQTCPDSKGGNETPSLDERTAGF